MVLPINLNNGYRLTVLYHQSTALTSAKPLPLKTNYMPSLYVRKKRTCLFRWLALQRFFTSAEPFRLKTQTNTVSRCRPQALLNPAGNPEKEKEEKCEKGCKGDHPVKVSYSRTSTGLGEGSSVGCSWIAGVGSDPYSSAVLHEYISAHCAISTNAKPFDKPNWSTVTNAAYHLQQNKRH